MGIIGDITPDVVEDVVEDGVEMVGEGIDAATDWSADRLEDVGLEGVSNFVRETGDSVANRLGADVDELRLDQTEDPRRLIHGSVGKLRSTAAHLRDFQEAFNEVGNGLTGVDADSLRGETADAFRERVSVEPRKWFTAAQACERAAGALNDFADTVEWAQGQAQEAIDRYRAAQRASEEARSAHNATVETYNDAVHAFNATPPECQDTSALPPRPGEFQDPGVAQVEEAAEILAEARRQRNEAHERARTAVEAARDAAPPKPSYGEQLGDAYTGVQLNASHFMGGVVRGTMGVANFARGVNPFDLYNLTHPADYLTQLNSTAAGLVRTANDPVGTAGTMWDSFQRDPAEGLGRLLPEVLGTRGAGGARAAASAAGRLPGSPPSGRAQLRDDGPDTHRTPDEARISGGTDPVDLATGRMYLPQTDVALAGVLPMVFRRRVESGYRAGRWFGPSWSSTVDQRLEIDAEGVVFLSEDGLLLAYPHPAPGVPTLPATGPRRPLERTAGGDYRLTDPNTGRTWHFAAPAGVENGGDGEAVLEEISDRNGHRLTFEYDEYGAPAGIVHSGGYHLKLTHENGRVTALRLAGGAGDGSDQELVRYGYTGGDLTEVINSRGEPLRFEYDDEHRVVAWTDTNGRRYDYVYDNLDRCVAEGGTDGHLSVRIAYGPTDPGTGHRVTTVTTPQGRATRYLVDRACQVIAVTDPLGHTTRTAFDTRGRALARTDALGRTTSFRYDEAGRLVTVIRPDGTGTSAVYNELDLPVEFTEPDHAVWRLEYDRLGNRTALTDPAGRTTRYEYDGHGHLTAITTPLGETTRLRCDAAGLPVRVTDPLGAVTTYQRDAFGRPISITNPLGATEHLEWTAESRLARHIDAGGGRQTWEYDGEGNCVRHTDANGGVSTFEYTHFDLLAARTDPDGTRYAFEHGADLSLRKVINPQGLTWAYAYDDAGRLASETDFDGRTLTYAYDANGRLLSRTNPLGQTVTFERDALGRVIRKEAEAHGTTYRYDPAGRLASATGPDTELVIRRDRVGRIKAEMVAGRGVLTHTYDELGRPTRRTTPTGATSAFRYDAAGRRTTLTASGHAVDFAYDAAGREISRLIGDTLRLSQTWDPAGRLTAQTLTGPTTRPLQHRTYTYRPDGHLTGLDDRTFDLDPMGRVTGVHAPDWSETYTYDQAGNQTHATWPTDHPGTAATGPRAYTGTRLTRAGRMRYEHDAAGRVTLRQKQRLSKKPDTWRYEWDAEDHLISVLTPDGTRWRYLYDPLGRRTAKQRLAPDGETITEQTDFTWDATTLIEQTTTTPALPHPVTLTWDHDGQCPIAQTERITTPDTQDEIDARFFAIITDLIGTPTHLIDETGTTAWHTRTTLWGTTAWSANSTAYTPLRFPGQYYDPETGLHYNHHRHYDPETARYTTPDPLGLSPAPNPITYVHNPLTWSDPLGLAPYPTPRTTQHGLDHSFDRHAAQWFGGEPNRSTQMDEWRDLIERTSRSSHRIPWSTGATETHAYLARIDNKWFAVQFDRTSGDLVTAFVPNSRQLSAMFSLLGK